MTKYLHKTYIDLLVFFKIIARCWTIPNTMEMLCKLGAVLYYLGNTSLFVVNIHILFSPDNLFLVLTLNIQQIGSAVLFSPISQKQNWEDSEVQQPKLGTEPKAPRSLTSGTEKLGTICLCDLTMPSLHSSEWLSFVFLLWI